MAPWLRFLEAWAVQQLLRTPAFHRAVEKVAKQVHRVRHGIPPEELGGTRLDDPSQPTFIRHFADELKTQLGNAEKQEANGALRTPGAKVDGINARRAGGNVGEHTSDAAWEHVRQDAGKTGSKKSVESVKENAEDAWHSAQKNASQAPKRGFMGEYMDALKEQLNNKNGR